MQLDSANDSSVDEWMNLKWKILIYISQNDDDKKCSTHKYLYPCSTLSVDDKHIILMKRNCHKFGHVNLPDEMKHGSYPRKKSWNVAVSMQITPFWTFHIAKQKDEDT